MLINLLLGLLAILVVSSLVIGSFLLGVYSGTKNAQWAFKPRLFQPQYRNDFQQLMQDKAKDQKVENHWKEALLKGYGLNQEEYLRKEGIK